MKNQYVAHQYTTTTELHTPEFGHCVFKLYCNTNALCSEVSIAQDSMFNSAPCCMGLSHFKNLYVSGFRFMLLNIILNLLVSLLF